MNTSNCLSRAFPLSALSALAVAFLLAGGDEIQVRAAEAGADPTSESYVADVRAAAEALEKGEPARAIELLRKYRPEGGQADLREFAWRCLWQLANSPTNAAVSSAGRTSAVGLAMKNIESPLVFLPDASAVASACADRIARQFDVKTLEPIVEMAGVEHPLILCMDGHTLIATGYSGLQVWDLRAQNLAPIWFFPRDGDWSVSAFSRDCQWAAVRNRDGRLQFVDALRRRDLTNFTAHQGAIRALAFSPDDRLVASAGMDRSVRLWDFQRRTLQNTLNAHTDTVVALAFSPDGKMLASAGADRVIRLWILASQAATQLAGHEGTVWSLAFTPDGKTLASGGADGVVRLWSPGRGLPLAVLRPADTGGPAQGRAPARLAFSPEGTVLAARLFDGTLQIWRAASLEVAH